MPGGLTGVLAARAGSADFLSLAHFDYSNLPHDGCHFLSVTIALSFPAGGFKPSGECGVGQRRRPCRPI